MKGLIEAQMNLSAPKTVISELDWNFDNVPDNELAACCYWEYARESAFIQDTLREYRDWFLAGGKWDENTGKLCARLEKIQCSSEQAGVFVRGCAFEPKMVRQSDDPEKPNYRHPDAPPITGSFPAPWQSLNFDERECRVRIRSHVEQFGIVPIKLAHWSWAKEIARECQRGADDQHEQRKAWEQKYLRKDAKGKFFMVADAPVVPEFGLLRPRTRWGVGETLMVDIAWDCFTNDEIATYFRKWVKVARPKEIPSPSDRGHKPGDWRANLTRLAVMRLLSQSPALAIVDDRQNKFRVIWQTKQFSGRKWQDVTKWHDARREAGQLFHKLFPFLAKAEMPLSWQRQAPGK
jgi:hypothetical protein